VARGERGEEPEVQRPVGLPADEVDGDPHLPEPSRGLGGEDHPLERLRVRGPGVADPVGGNRRRQERMAPYRQLSGQGPVIAAVLGESAVVRWVAAHRLVTKMAKCRAPA
jgi:hypothetical protein